MCKQLSEKRNCLRCHKFLGNHTWIPGLFRRETVVLDVATLGFHGSKMEKLTLMIFAVPLPYCFASFRTGKRVPRNVNWKGERMPKLGSARDSLHVAKPSVPGNKTL